MPLMLALPLMLAATAAEGVPPAPNVDAPIVYAAPAASTLPARRFVPVDCSRGCLNPIQAVTYASYIGNGAGVAGTYTVPIVAVGFQNGRYFLNSESDYRDRNCLTVAITPGVLQRLTGTDDLDTARRKLEGRHLLVRGIARQVRIDFTEDGKPTGKYYYQIHVDVANPNLIRLADG